MIPRPSCRRGVLDHASRAWRHGSQKTGRCGRPRRAGETGWQSQRIQLRSQRIHLRNVQQARCRGRILYAGASPAPRRDAKLRRSKHRGSVLQHVMMRRWHDTVQCSGANHGKCSRQCSRQTATSWPMPTTTMCRLFGSQCHHSLGRQPLSISQHHRHYNQPPRLSLANGIHAPDQGRRLPARG
jgi:hypothetical protein